MKCSKCGHVSLEKAARFCSQCGLKLTAEPANTQDTDNQPRPLKADPQATNGKSAAEKKETPGLGRTSPKRHNEEPSSHQKKKKRKKRNKKRKNRTQTDEDQSLQTESRRSSTSSESSRNATDETPDSLQDESSLLHSQPSPSPDAPSVVNPSETPALTANHPEEGQGHSNMEESNTQTSKEDQKITVDIGKTHNPAVDVKNPAPQAGTGAGTLTQNPKDQKAQSKNSKSGSTEAHSTLDKNPAPQAGTGAGTLTQNPKDQKPQSKNSKSGATETQPTLAQIPAPQAGTGKGTQTQNPKDQKAQRKNPKSGSTEMQPTLEKNPAPQAGTGAGNQNSNLKDQKDKSNKSKSGSTETQPPLDQNANVDAGVKPMAQSKGNEPGQQDQTQSVAVEKKMVFGNQKITKVSSGSSVDPEVTKEAQQCASGKVRTPQASAPASPPLKRPKVNQTILADDRLTIYFHAVLSKDFKFDPDEDHIFISAGPPLGSWEENTAKLQVTRDCGEHGFLVEGSLIKPRSQIEAMPIPYKYCVYRNKKKTFEYEFIYKMDSGNKTTNRCLFVKSRFLNEEGDWHQYDDIICAQPSKTFLKRVKDVLWPEQRKSLIQGREIAGRIMLSTIFDLLTSWSETNLKSFLIQLHQFFEVYSKPFVFEDTQKKWHELNYHEEDVTKLLKEFMLMNLTPELLKEGEGTRRYIPDPLRAAVIFLSVCDIYSIRIIPPECHRLCHLLCLPKQSKEDFLQYWEEFQKDVAILRNLPELLMLLINVVKRAAMPKWILVLPVHHLLGSNTKPFEAPVSKNLNYGLNWAGLQGVEMGRTYMNSEDRQALVNLIKSHRHLMEVDTLFARSCLYLMSLDHLVEFIDNIDIELLDLLVAFSNKVPQDIDTVSKPVTDILSHIQTRLIEEKYSSFTENYRRDCMAAALKLLGKICKAVRQPGFRNQDNTSIPVACMNLVTSVLDFAHRHDEQQGTQNGDTQNLYHSIVSDAMTILREWIVCTFKQDLMVKSMVSLFQTKISAEMEMWNNIIAINFNREDHVKTWRQTFTRDFEGKYKKEYHLDQIEFYCTHFEDLSNSHPHISVSIERCALEAVTSLCQTKSEGKLFERLKINWKFGNLISTIIQKSWPKDGQGNYETNNEMVLQHLLSWTAAKDVFQLHGAEERLIKELSPEAQDRLAMAISSFTAVINQLVHGDIKMSMLHVILNRRDFFLELLKINCLCENEQYGDAAKMKRLLERRDREIQAVYHEKRLVDVFLKMSHKLEEYMTVDVADIEERHMVNVADMSLNHFMEVHHFDELPGDRTGVVTYFDLSNERKEMAEVLLMFEESYIFNGCWEKQAKLWASEEASFNENSDEDQVADIKATPEMIYEDIFLPCTEKYKKIYTSLKNGSMTLEVVSQLFGVYKGKYEELTKELEVMRRNDSSTDTNWINNRVQQIEQYHELHLAVESARIIMTVKETLCLQGDFGVLKTLTEASQADFQKEQLNRIDNDLMHAKKDLVDITESRRLCLQELGQRRGFVKWVKDALEDINELKVFVDLASISAGENDMDVDRVACFHDAVLGYSSMLYELKADSGFPAFKDMLMKLWKALENDSNLPKKLRDSARHLEWLKTVKDSHGSVELSSLSLASAINNKGIYLISAENVKTKSLDTVLKLQIPEGQGDGRQIRWYSLDDLRELQNKLMLMSGKGDQGQHEVDHFVEVFAGVQRLSEAFIALYTAGNPMFRQWEAQINCRVNRNEPRIFVDFHLDSVPGAVVVEGSVEEQLPELCRKMEKCLDFWMEFVDKQRSQHYYLNYFTAEQIVYLCSKLTQQNVTNMEDQVLMMLSFVKQNCSSNDVRQVWHTLQYEILTKPETQNEDIEFQTFVMMPGNEQNTPDSFSEDEPLPSLFEHTNGSQKFDVIWNAYMRDMVNFLPHILDVKNLGRLLEILANREVQTKEDDSDEASLFDSKASFMSRQLPKGLVSGNPNLIICPQDEVLTSCLSIYMRSEAEPLPTYDEVLLCNSLTSYEQVELFLRRCLSTGYRGEKIYCLLYGDLLTYDVSSRLESFFQRMKMQSRKDYRLVIICSSEREHTYIPSAFSQYRLHIVPNEPLERIQGYLHRHYIVSADQCSAAAAFKDRLCVGVVSSKRAGVGKSLYIKRLYERLKHSTTNATAMKCIRLIEPKVDENDVLQSLLDVPKGNTLMFHFDVTSSVKKGLHEFLFKILVLRYLMDSEGRVWKCSDKQLYVVELLEVTGQSTSNSTRPGQTVNSTFIDVFPNIVCRPPKEVLMLEMRKQEYPTTVNSDDPLMDVMEFRSEAFQRPYQYLTRFHNSTNIDDFNYTNVEGSHVECLQMLLMYCGIMDPSWAELRNFAWFLNLQLQDSETSVFCNPAFTGDTLAGFKTFVVDFMILMAKDFATPSLSISDQSPGRLQMDLTGVREKDLAPFKIRKRWETEPHPYIFFNDDHVSMTFIGFHLVPNAQNYVDAVEPTSGKVIKENVMTLVLYEGLKLQRVPFNINFDALPREEKIQRICNVLGVEWPLDPDTTYELTTDNILKMLAIHMRFRCGIPVIIMGETGCGKTRLIKFLCELRRCGVPSENMKLVKVHGGTTSEMIYSKVREAEDTASINKQEFGFDSVLFFDEANTTEAISSIKEVLCDKTVKGEHLKPQSGLKIIAACNPYRKHTDQMIERLESAGLGYRVRSEETDEKLGSIPLRQLVYRVQALPPSMVPLVWDFGQLNDHTEKIYIQQIVQRVVKSNTICQSYAGCIVDVLSASQMYMRKRKDECCFVSLRDVERCMQAFVWFYDNHAMFFTELHKSQTSDCESEENPERTDRSQRQPDVRDPVVWSLVMAIGVCYHACLEKKDEYRQNVSEYLPTPYSPAKVMQEISLMQDLLLSGVPMGDTIARNSALKENVFMMVLCIELRIPLFLVGKPGSSKSLSKTLVADAMQGQAAHSDLFKKLKQIHLVSFQCSPHSTPEGIINTFKQCGRFQEGKNLQEYISVVVLDEIGLAEDSPKMPLKTLHPLLEEGCIDDDPLPHKKVGFIGISNWALDPAKMNRGIFVSRGDPDEKELIESAKGICSSDAMVLEKVRDFFQPFAKAYLHICHKQGKGFFGLRDYYSLIKMIFAVSKASQRKPTPEETVKAVVRNFSGKDNVDAVGVFTEGLQMTPDMDSVSATQFVRENIQTVGQDEECRYLLVLTKNYAALQILQQSFFSETCRPEIIFGSSFPKDQEYTQICRNINRVKICMETGQIVVLLNLQNLYESLYDALNQYYVCLGGQKYVDLGLGTHRVKCRVHKNFRLVVIEEREVVYEQFPIPLINRLEKHYLDIHTVLRLDERRMVDELERWVRYFVSLSNPNLANTYKYQPPDVFIGYHSDTCASVVLQVTEKYRECLDISDPEQRALDEAKLILLRCATPDSVVRLDGTELPKVEIENLARVYFEELKNSCLADFILAHTRQAVHGCSCFIEVTTFSRLLTTSDLVPLEQMLLRVELLSLQQFDTEHSFLKKIRNFLTAENGNAQHKVLIIQCDFDEASHSANLIASAKYSSINEINKITQERAGSDVFLYFITRLPRMEGGTSYVGFHGGPWRSVHIDDLRRSEDIVSDIKALQNMTLSQLFETGTRSSEAMEEDELYTENEEVEEAEKNGWDKIVDTTALLRSCVQTAVGMLRDQVESGLRSTRRVEILLTLLSDNNGINGEFREILKRHLHSLLAVDDGNMFSSLKSNWVIKVASNIDALQEGGTFRHTLWKRVQAVVAPLLAQLLSVIDRDQNLDILLDGNCSESLKILWLDIFGTEKFLQIPNLTMKHISEKTIPVQNYIAQDKIMSCSLPFSWRIKDFLEDLLVYTLQHEGHTEKEFDEFFWKTPLGRHIAKGGLEMQIEFFQRYLQDFITMTMNVASQEDVKLMCSALNCCVNELRSKLGDAETVVSLPWVHVAYNKFKNRLQSLGRIICIKPQVTWDLVNNLTGRDGEELVHDVYAALACVEYLEPGVLDTDAQRQTWLRQVKKLQVPIELICSEDSARHYGERSKAIACRVRVTWNRIFSVSLFVEHMFGIDDVEKKLTPFLLDHEKKLGQILENNSDLKTQACFEAVIGFLKSCKDGAVALIFRFGAPICPVCMGDPQNPVCLPCDHIYCVTCIKNWLIPGQMYCPLCMQPVDDNFPIVPSDAIRILVNQRAQLRRQCNAFFIDIVSTMCFKDNTPPCSNVIYHLLSFLMVEAGAIPAVPAKNSNRKKLTKELSPFDDSVDKNPVVRSVVLKLLLKYSFDKVKRYLQQHLTAVEQSLILEESDKTELYCLYLNCLEDSMFERLQFRSAADRQKCLQNESDFLTEYLQTHGRSAEAATVEYLQQVARVRMDLDMAVQLLMEELRSKGSLEGNQSGSNAYITSVKNLCEQSGNDWYRVYLIRKICSQHGVDFAQRLLKGNRIPWLFPKEVQHQSEEAPTIDQYLVCGENYKTIRDALAKGWLEGKLANLDETCEACTCSKQEKTLYLLLALFREVTTCYRNANAHLDKQVKPLRQYIEKSKFLGSPAVKSFAMALTTNSLGPLTVAPGASNAHLVLVELVVHLAAVLLCGNQEFLRPLKQLSEAPTTMQAAFLPTMPEDMLAVAQNVMGQLQWFTCANGHPCTIGECGRPMQQSHCVDCGVLIGGANHLTLPGMTPIQVQGDRTQTGHILGDAGRRDTDTDTLDTKSMSPIPFNIVRMLTHMAMLLGASKDPQSISNIIKPPVANPGPFLFAHLRKDFQHLIRSLGKGTDDTISTVHLLISSLLKTYQLTWPTPFDNLLSTKEKRNGWEMEMSNAIIVPQLKHLDGRLKEANAFIRADSRVKSNAVMRIVYGDPSLVMDSFPQNSLIHSSAVWSCREKVDLLTLSHTVEQNDGKDMLPVLWRFLHKEAELRLVKHLPDILALQKDLIKRFQNNTEQTFGSIAEFLQSQKAASLKSQYEKNIKIFLTTWNQLRVSLTTNGEIKIPAEFCKKNLDVDSDFKVLLPQRQGPGLCSTALVSYLIALHNDLVYCVDKHTREETSYKVSAADLTELHVIRYEVEKDLMPLVLSNTQYSIERGTEVIHEYDLPKIQQQIMSRFLLGKPLITLQGIPTLVNRHDRDYEIILKDVKTKVQQEPLQTLTLFAVAGELHSYSEVCDALSTLEVALGFLAMTGGDPDMQLSTYLEEVLQMGKQLAAHILKALRMCCLKHCVSLWQLLGSLKSENLLRLKRDPFVEVSEKYKDPLGEDNRRLLTAFFSKISADAFMLEMHEFLVLVLRKPNAPTTYRPEWGLKETLLSYIERKDQDIPPDVDQYFPDEICLSHYVEAWKFIVTYKQESGQRQ